MCSSWTSSVRSETCKCAILNICAVTSTHAYAHAAHDSHTYTAHTFNVRQLEQQRAFRDIQVQYQYMCSHTHMHTHTQHTTVTLTQPIPLMYDSWNSSVRSEKSRRGVATNAWQPMSKALRELR